MWQAQPRTVFRSNKVGSCPELSWAVQASHNGPAGVVLPHFLSFYTYLINASSEFSDGLLSMGLSSPRG